MSADTTNNAAAAQTPPPQIAGIGAQAHGAARPPVGGSLLGIGRDFWLVWAQGCLWLSLILVCTAAMRIARVNFAYYFSAHNRGFFEEAARLLHDADALFWFRSPFGAWLCGGLLVYMLFRRTMMPVAAFGVYQLSLLRALRKFALGFAFFATVMIMYRQNPFGYDNQMVALVAFVFCVIIGILAMTIALRKKKGVNNAS